MVEGVERLRAKFNAVPEVIRKGLTEELERIAAQIVAQMNGLKPLPEIEIGWTWGDAPAGTMTIGEVRGQKFGKLVIRIYATAFTSEYPKGTGGFPAVARWFEFGTGERIDRKRKGKSSGRIVAQPYFFPVYRANKATARRRISARITREVKKLNA